MSAIFSLSSFSRPTQGATLLSAQQAQRGTTYGSTSVARSGNTVNTSSAYCPTCGGSVGSARSASNASSSYCPTCNTVGGRQSSITTFNSSASRTSAAATPSAGSRTNQGGQICVACAYQGR